MFECSTCFFFSYLDESLNCLVQMTLFMTGRKLYANTRLAFRHYWIVESGYIKFPSEKNKKTRCNEENTLIPFSSHRLINYGLLSTGRQIGLISKNSPHRMASSYWLHRPLSTRQRRIPPASSYANTHYQYKQNSCCPANFFLQCHVG